MNKRSAAALLKAIDAVAEKVKEIPDEDDRARRRTKQSALLWVGNARQCVVALTDVEPDA